MRNIVSPYGLAVLPTLIFLVAWFFPPDVYTRYINEPDLMFMNPQILFFYFANVVAYCLGASISQFFFERRGLRSDSGKMISRFSSIYLAIPILLSSLGCLLLLVKIGGKIDLLSLLLSLQGSTIKAAGGASGNLTDSSYGAFLTILTGVLWWALFRLQQLDLSGLSIWISRAAFTLGFGVAAMTCIATVDRTSLMPLLSGLLLIFLYGRVSRKNISLSRLLLPMVGSVFLILFVFLLFSFLRGAFVGRSLAISLMGYTIVSFNRMAALMGGIMHYMYQGRGVYLAPFIHRSEKLNTIINFRAYFNWPTPYALLRSEFPAELQAGLNSGYNWSGAFGYLYADLGWWTPCYLLSMGVATGYSWYRFRKGGAIAILMYPWLAFNVLFWVGYNLVLNERILRLLITGVALLVYDKLLLRRLPEHSGEYKSVGPRALPNPRMSKSRVFSCS